MSLSSFSKNVSVSRDRNPNGDGNGNGNGDVEMDMDEASDDAADDDEDGDDVTPSVAALEAVAKAMRTSQSKLSVTPEEEGQQEEQQQGEEDEEDEKQAMKIGTVPNAASLAAIAAAVAPVKWGKEGAEERKAAAAAAMVASPPGGDGLTDLWPFQKDKILRRRGSRGSECSTNTSLMSGYSSVYRRGPSSALGHATNGGGGGEKNSDSGSSSTRRVGKNNKVNHSGDRLETRHEEERGGEWRGPVKTSPATAAARVRGDGTGNGSLSPPLRTPPSHEAVQEAARLGVASRVREGWRGENGGGANGNNTLGEFLDFSGGGGVGGDDNDNNDNDTSGGGGRARTRQGGGSSGGGGRGSANVEKPRRRRYTRRNSEGSLQFTAGEGGLLSRDETAGGFDRAARVSSLKVLKPKVEVFLDNEDGEWGQAPTNSRFRRLWWPGRQVFLRLLVACCM